MFDQIGGDLHGAGEHPHWRGSRIPRNLHNECKPAHPAHQQEPWLSNPLNNPGCADIEVKLDFAFTQVNQYEDIHGGRPFASAPDDLVTEVALKRF